MSIYKTVTFALISIIITSLIGVILLSGFKIFGDKITQTDHQKMQLQFEKLEFAITDQEKQLGYMNRELICSRCGMLFVFEKSQPLSFWMKNTLVPLKITFIDENGVVINSEIGQPKVTSPTVNSLRPAKYVLEVSIDSPIDLKPNQQIDIKKMLTENKTHSDN